MNKSWEQIKKEFFQPFEWNTTTNIYTAGANIVPVKGCNSFTVTNVGDVIANINGELLFPSATPATVAGDSISFGGNLGEIYKGNLVLQFVLPTAGVAPRIIITQKFYIHFE